MSEEEANKLYASAFDLSWGTSREQELLRDGFDAGLHIASQSDNKRIKELEEALQDLCDSGDQWWCGRVSEWNNHEAFKVAKKVLGDQS